MADDHPELGDELQWSGRATPQQAFDQATLDLAMEGIHIDPNDVPPLTGYRDGTMTYAEAVEAMRRRHRNG